MIAPKRRAASFVHDFASFLFFFGGAVAILTFGFWLFQIANGSAHATVIGYVPRALFHGPEEIVERAHMWVDVQDVPWLLALIRTVSYGGLWAFGLIGLWQLRQVAGSAATGDPFDAANVNRLRLFSGVLLVYQPLSQLLSKIFGEALLAADGSVVKTVVVSPFSWTLVISAVAVFALAQVFAEGVRMRSDLEGTV